MFELIIGQKDYNRVKFHFDTADDAAQFINNCMTYDDGKTEYTMKYQPEKEGEEDGNKNE